MDNLFPGLSTTEKQAALKAFNELFDRAPLNAVTRISNGAFGGIKYVVAKVLVMDGKYDAKVIERCTIYLNDGIHKNPRFVKG